MLLTAAAAGLAPTPSLTLRPPPKALPPTLSPAHAEAIDAVTLEHAAAVSKQEERWALDYEPLPHFFMEDDFKVATRVQANYAGPDAVSLHEGGVVHETTAHILAYMARIVKSSLSKVCGSLGVSGISGDGSAGRAAVGVTDGLVSLKLVVSSASGNRS